MDSENKIQCVDVWEEWPTRRAQEAQEASAIETRQRQLNKQACLRAGMVRETTSSGSRLASPGWASPTSVLYLLQFSSCWIHSLESLCHYPFKYLSKG